LSTKEYFNNDVGDTVIPLKGKFSPYNFSPYSKRNSTMNSRARKLNFRATKLQSPLRERSGVRDKADKASSEVIKLSSLGNLTPKPLIPQRFKEQR
jgi:hypothetical protein